MSRVELKVFKPWITERLGELLDVEDDVVIEFVFNQLEEQVKMNDVFVEYRTRPDVCRL